MLNSIVPTSPAVDIMTPYTAFMAAQVAPRLQRRVAARWKRWSPWVLVDARRRHADSAVISAELTRLRHPAERDELKACTRPLRTPVVIRQCAIKVSHREGTRMVSHCVDN